MKLDLKQNKVANGVVNTSTLASHLGLSRWTVSRVLNEHPGVKEATRERVLTAVAELGFEPNLQARSLRGLPTKLVGVSFQQFETPILARKSAEMQERLSEEGYRGIFELPGWDASREADVVRHFLSFGVDGIVLIGSTLSADDEIFQIVRDRGVAMVAVDPRWSLPIPQVELDRAQAMQLNVDHLYSLGHRKFGLFGVRSDDMYLTRRVKGLKERVQHYGLSWDNDVKEYWDTKYDIQDPEYGAEMARRFLATEDSLATGLIALNDRIALGMLKVFRERGIEIPRDYSLIGFDNLEESEWISPPLTTIDQNIQTLIKTASDALLKTINGEVVSSLSKIEPQLIIRGSTSRISN